MKWSILINQVGAAHFGLADKTDLADWAILDYIAGWQISDKAEKLDGKIWINYSNLIKEMPLLHLNKKQSISNRISKLRDLGLIETSQSIDKRLFVKVTSFYSDVALFQGQGVPEKGQGVPEKGQGVPEKGQGVPEKGHEVFLNKDIHTTTTYPTTNETTISNHKESAPKKAKNSGGENEKNLQEKKSSHAFVKPTPDEIASYANEQGFEIDSNYFFDYYESKGWLVGSTKMKSWQATVRNWHRRDKEQQGGSNATPKVKKEFHHDYELSDEFLKKHNMDCIDSVAVPIHSGFIEG
jgi:hypothetical protein